MEKPLLQKLKNQFNTIVQKLEDSNTKKYEGIITSVTSIINRSENSDFILECLRILNITSVTDVPLALQTLLTQSPKKKRTFDEMNTVPSQHRVQSRW